MWCWGVWYPIFGLIGVRVVVGGMVRVLLCIRGVLVLCHGVFWVYWGCWCPVWWGCAVAYVDSVGR